jgi:hypothetical protein
MSCKKWASRKINDNTKNSVFKGNIYWVEISVIINKSGLDAMPPFIYSHSCTYILSFCSVILTAIPGFL